MTIAMTAHQKLAARLVAGLFGALLLIAAVAEFAIVPLELLLDRQVEHVHREAWLSGAFLVAGLMLLFPDVVAKVYEWAKPYIPTISFKRGG